MREGERDLVPFSATAKVQRARGSSKKDRISMRKRERERERERFDTERERDLLTTFLVYKVAPKVFVSHMIRIQLSVSVTRLDD